MSTNKTRTGINVCMNEVNVRRKKSVKNRRQFKTVWTGRFF